MKASILNFDAGLFEKIREAFPSIDTKQTIRRLSKGMQKQVAFWLAISARPQILILGETGGWFRSGDAKTDMEPDPAGCDRAWNDRASLFP